MSKEIVTNREVSKKLGRAIRYYREAQGVSLAELGDRAGISASYLNRIELGERLAPSLPIIKNIADALNVPLEHLIELSIESTGEPQLLLSELILGNDFTIRGKAVNQEIKECLLTLIETIVDFKWGDEEKIEEIYELLILVEDFKQLI